MLGSIGLRKGYFGIPLSPNPLKHKKSIKNNKTKTVNLVVTPWLACGN